VGHPSSFAHPGGVSHPGGVTTFHSGTGFHTVSPGFNGGRNWNGSWNNWNGNWNNWNWNHRGNGFWWGFGLGLGFPFWAYNSFAPGVWIGSYDNPGYFAYYGDDEVASDGIYYGPDAALTTNQPDMVPEDIGAPPAAQNAGPADSQMEGRAGIAIRVPTADARVWIEDQETKETGLLREFRSPVLEQGKSYTYDIRAEWKEGGQVRTQTRKFPIHSGDHIMVVFGDKKGDASQARPPAGR
jgi:uncharacterized protein (TIGR03000 family)